MVRPDTTGALTHGAVWEGWVVEARGVQRDAGRCPGRGAVEGGKWCLAAGWLLTASGGSCKPARRALPLGWLEREGRGEGRDAEGRGVKEQTAANTGARQ